MDLNLSGKVAVVTGGSKGIGLAFVRSLAAEGASVVAGARSPAGPAAVVVVLGRLAGSSGKARLAVHYH
jgi:NAD(P)-dependent dehydrogenase (short-subunit alcohol dehydrogenase family)